MIAGGDEGEDDYDYNEHDSNEEAEEYLGDEDDFDRIDQQEMEDLMNDEIPGLADNSPANRINDKDRDNKCGTMNY
jgi:hypothetical protein